MIDCHKCKYYYVTWDKNFPHGCRALEFKSKGLPAAAVLATSRQECLMYKKKTLRRKA